jgi:PAS domain S-box-containing protein
MALAIVVLVGWFTNTPVLMQIVPDLAPMQRNTAACFLLLGLAMIWATTAHPPAVTVLAAGVCTTVAALTLCEYLFQADLGIDQILGPDYIIVQTSSPGRMAPTTAVCFVVAAGGLWLHVRPLSKRTGLIVAILGSIVAAVGVASWMGFAVGSSDAFGWGLLTRLALLTALAFSGLGFGMVALAWHADVKTSGTPGWLPASLAIGVSTGGIGFWQALIATERSRSTVLPTLALVSGFAMAGVVALAVFLAQRAHAAALALAEANQRLTDHAAQLSASEQRLGVQYAVTRVLAESRSLVDALPSLLRALGERLGWQAAELWQVSRDGQHLSRVAAWHEPGPLFATSALMTGDARLPLGVGLPGLTAQAGTPYWMPDVCEDATFQRTAMAEAVGLRGAFAVPIGGADQVIGSMTFFSSRRRERDEAMLQMLTGIGSQVGQFIERKRLEDEVDRFFNLSRDLLCVATFDGHFTRVNPSWQRTLQYTPDDLQNQSFLDLVHPDDLERTIGAMQALAAGGDIVDFENRYRAKSGEYRWMQWTSTPYLDEQVVYAVARDVTDRRRAEIVLQETQREQMRLKDGFLSHVSHELRSPLTAVYGLVTVIGEELAAQLTPDQQEYVRIIVKNLRQLEAMIDDLLEVTRAQTGKLNVALQSMSLHDAVGDVIETLRLTAAAKDIALSSDVPETMPAAYADPTRMQQILTNLINNAVKFTPAHGSVQVHARVRQMDPTHLEVEVSDTGCGISAADSGRIFERLFQVGEAGQANRTGLGLGLDICKQLVERQGGQIWVTSEILKGSTFSFTVPVAAR